MAGSGIAFNAMHPGWASTPGLSDSLPGFERVMGPILRTPEEGIDTIIWLATARRDEIGNGLLFLDRRARPFDRAPFTRLDGRERRSLWETVVRRSGEANRPPTEASRRPACATARARGRGLMAACRRAGACR